MVIDLSRMIKAPSPVMVRTGTLSNRVFEFDPTEHECKGHSKDHDHYTCPKCVEVAGEGHNTVKLYWNTIKLIGMCFACGKVAVLKSDKPIHELQISIVLNKLISDLARNMTIMNMEMSSFSEINYEKISKPPSEVALEYMESRVGVYGELMEALHVREAKGAGVTFPVILNDRVVSYILRFYRPNGKMKYYLPENSKSLYSPLGVHTGVRVPEITLVEGPFDAIAALIDGFPNPIAIFGKTITPLQIYLLRSMAPDRVNYYLDETELSQTLRKSVRNELATASDHRVIRSTGDDPEERLKWKLANREEEYLIQIVENINRIKENASPISSYSNKVVSA